MTNSGVLGFFGDIFQWWQFIPLVILIGLIIFWIQYRKKQM